MEKIWLLQSLMIKFYLDMHSTQIEIKVNGLVDMLVDNLDKDANQKGLLSD